MEPSLNQSVGSFVGHGTGASVDTDVGTKSTNYVSTSGAPRGAVSYDAGVHTCHLCGRLCKGRRGLQAHLRACEKRRSSNAMPEKRGSGSVTVRGNGTRCSGESTGGGSAAAPGNDGERAPSDGCRSPSRRHGSPPVEDVSDPVVNSGGDSPRARTESGPGTSGPAWTRNAQVGGNFACRSCGRSFATKIGLGQHERRAHAADYHSGLEIGRRTGNKRRWSHEEKVLVAREEIRLCGESRNLNLELSLVLPDRTFESIKGLRKSPAYRALVSELRSESDRREFAADDARPAPGRTLDGGQDATGTPDQMVEDPALPTSQEEAIEALAVACRRDVDALCLSPEEVEEIIGGAVDAVRDPLGPSAQRIQTLVDKEYDQWVASLPIPKPKASPTTSDGNRNGSGRTRRPRRRPTAGQRPPNKKQQRRKLYGVLQQLYRKNRSRCAKTVLSGDWAKEKRTTPLEEQESYWKPLFEEPSKPDSREGRPVSRALFEVSLPTSIEEYERVLRSTHNSSPGLDGVDRKVLCRVVPRIGVAHMNLWLLACRPPEAFKVGVTVPLPKAADAAGPEDHRPITIGPMFCRLFHRLLAHRAEGSLPLSERQKAFREGDGLADNVWILRSIIDDCKARHRPLCATFVDVRKAFDTVSHESIVRAAERIGFPPGLVAYIRCLYTDGVTQIRVGRLLGSLIRPRRGVRQGDPLSPLLFCAVMDWVLSRLDDRLGLELGGGVRVNHLAFADDVVLLSTSPEAMKRLLCELECGLEEVGLRPNPAKSASLRIAVQGKAKKWYCPAQAYLTLGGMPVPPIDIRGSYKYLGIKTGAGQKIGDGVSCKLEEGLRQLSKAPLKPQQRLFILRVHVIPGLYHGLVLGRHSKSLLVHLDRRVRAAARRWLHLPHDVPQALFHAHSSEGGLGLPELLVQVPLMRRARVDRLFDRAGRYYDPVLAAITGSSAGLRKEQERWQEGVKCYSETVTSRTTRERATAAALHTTIDGSGLSDAHEVPEVSRWVTSGSGLMSGKSFVDAMFVRAGCLYSKVRAARGRPDGLGAGDMCEVCPCKRESLAHVIQQCPRSSQARTERHNSVLRLLAQKLTTKGFRVLEEPAIVTDEGVRRPDAFVYKPGVSAWVIDVTITSDAPGDLSAAHARKVRKYDKPQIRTWASGQAGVPTSAVSFTSLTFNWRGALSTKSARDMKSLGIAMSTLEIMSTRVLEGGYRAWRQSRDATWIRMDEVPCNPGSARDAHRPGRLGGGRRYLAARPPRPAGPSAAGHHGRPVQRFKTGRERHRAPGPPGRAVIAPMCQ